MNCLSLVSIIVANLDSFEEVGETNQAEDVRCCTDNCCDQCLQVKPIKYMFGVKFFFINIFEGLLQNLGQLVEIRA